MNKKGFTLTELVATMVILGVILLIAVPSYNSYIEKAKDRKCEADKKAIFDATNAYIIREGYWSSIFVSNLGLSSEYEKYNDIEISITGTPYDGITNYSFAFSTSSDEIEFETKCRE